MGTRTGLSLIPATASLDKVTSISIHPLYGISVPFAAESSNDPSPSSSVTGFTSTSGRYSVFQLDPTIDTCEPVSHSIVVSTPPKEARTKHFFPNSFAVCSCLPLRGALRLKSSAFSVFSSGQYRISTLFVLAVTFLIRHPDAQCSALPHL